MLDQVLRKLCLVHRVEGMAVLERDAGKLIEQEWKEGGLDEMELLASLGVDGLVEGWCFDSECLQCWTGFDDLPRIDVVCQMGGVYLVGWQRGLSKVEVDQ